MAEAARNDVMQSGQQDQTLSGLDRRDPPQMPCSTRSAEILLAFLILVSLNIVAVYDWLLSKLLRIAPRRPKAATSFDTSHISKGFARRIRP
jgi:hypothetical protein